MHALLSDMAANLQRQNLQFARMEREWEKDRAEARELRQRDLAESQAALEATRSLREEDIETARALREWDIEEAALIRSRDLDSSRVRETQLRQEVRATLQESLQTSQDEFRQEIQLMQSSMSEMTALLRGIQVSSPPDTTALRAAPAAHNSPRTPSQVEELDDISVDDGESTSVVSTTRPRLTDVPPSHLQPPVNFPSSLLLLYERQGFPVEQLRNYFNGTYIAPATPFRTALQQRERAAAPFNMSIWADYNGPVLYSVEPLALVQFMVDWKAYQCTGTQHPLHHGISPQAAFSIVPSYEHYQSYSDEEIWAILWELFGPDDQAGLKTLLHEVAELLFVLLSDMPLSPESCRGVRGFAAVVSTIVAYLNPGIYMSVDELSKLFLKCLPDSFSSPIRNYIQTYKTATVAGRYLYKAEAWNLKMTLMVLEAFITYSLRRIAELQTMLPASAHYRPAAAPAAPFRRSGDKPGYASASLKLTPALKAPPPPSAAPHAVSAFGISASAVTTAAPSSGPYTSQDHRVKQQRVQPPGPHASIPLSPTAAATLSQQTNPGKLYASKYSTDFIRRAKQWYDANFWTRGNPLTVRADLIYQSQTADGSRYTFFDLLPNDPRCPHCGGPHIGNTAFSLPSLGCVQGPDGGLLYDRQVILLCPNYVHPSASMSPDYPRLRPLPGTPDYDPSIYQPFADDKGTLTFFEYIKHAFPGGFPLRQNLPLRGAIPFQDRERARAYTTATGTRPRKRPGSGFLFASPSTGPIPSHHERYDLTFSVGLPSDVFSPANVIKVQFMIDTGATYSTITFSTLARLQYFFGSAVRELMVPGSTFDFPMLSGTARVNATGNWLILYLTPSMSELPHPVMVFVGANVADVLAVTSPVEVHWLESRLKSASTLASPLADATPRRWLATRRWSVDDLLNITRWWSRDETDRRAYQRRALVVDTDPRSTALFDFLLDTGSPVNIWPSDHVFHPHAALELQPHLELRLIDHASVIRLTHQVSVSIRLSPTAAPTTLPFYICPDISTPLLGSNAPLVFVSDWYLHSTHPPRSATLIMAPEPNPQLFVRPRQRGFQVTIPVDPFTRPLQSLEISPQHTPTACSDLDSIMSYSVEDPELDVDPHRPFALGPDFTTGSMYDADPYSPTDPALSALDFLARTYAASHPDLADSHFLHLTTLQQASVWSTTLGAHRCRSVLFSVWNAPGCTIDAVFEVDSLSSYNVITKATLLALASVSSTPIPVTQQLFAAPLSHATHYFNYAPSRIPTSVYTCILSISRTHSSLPPAEVVFAVIPEGNNVISGLHHHGVLWLLELYSTLPVVHSGRPSPTLYMPNLPSLLDHPLLALQIADYPSPHLEPATAIPQFHVLLCPSSIDCDVQLDALADSCSDFPVISQSLLHLLVMQYPSLTLGTFVTDVPWTFTCGSTRQSIAVSHFIYLAIILPSADPHNLQRTRIPFAVLDSLPSAVLIFPTALLPSDFICDLLRHPPTRLHLTVDLSFNSATPTRKSSRATRRPARYNDGADGATPTTPTPPTVINISRRAPPIVDAATIALAFPTTRRAPPIIDAAAIALAFPTTRRAPPIIDAATIALAFPSTRRAPQSLDSSQPPAQLPFPRRRPPPTAAAAPSQPSERPRRPPQNIAAGTPPSPASPAQPSSSSDPPAPAVLRLSALVISLLDFDLLSQQPPLRQLPSHIRHWADQLRLLDTIFPRQAPFFWTDYQHAVLRTSQDPAVWNPCPTNTLADYDRMRYSDYGDQGTPSTSPTEHAKAEQHDLGSGDRSPPIAVAPEIATQAAGSASLSPCLALGASTATPTTQVIFGSTPFIAAADSFSGVNTIRTNALSRIQAASSIVLQPRACNYSLIVANSQTLRVSSELLLNFVLPSVSQVVHAAYFLIADTPYEVILSHTTLLSTGLGYHIYSNHPPGSPLTPDNSIDTDFDSLFSSLYFPLCSVDVTDYSFETAFDYTIFSLDVTSDGFNDFKFDYVQPFSDKISTVACADPPTIHPEGTFGAALTNLVEDFSDSVFRGSLYPTPAEVPLFNIEFSTTAPHLGYRPPRRLSPPLQQSLRDTVDDLLQQGIIVPSTSCFASPVVMAIQKNKIRMCIDYTELNSATTKMRYPLPNASAIFPNLAGNKFFASMDLRSGYHQLGLTDHASNWSAFVTPFGQYRFLRVPFGLANAPSWFQRAMTEVVLQGLVGIVCYVFIDDIIVFAPTESEFLARLRLVLQRLHRHRIVLKGAKCHFGCPDVKFLGFIADATGVRHDPTRCSDFLAIPLPPTKKGLRSFLGLGNFFRDFVHNYSTYSKKLSRLLNAGTSPDVTYTDDATEAFNVLKTLIGGTVKNFYLDYDFPIYLHTDASTSGIGAILFQVVDDQFRPIQFVSRSLSEVEARWQIQELESFAIIHAITKLDHFLKGAHFIVHTDHRNLVFIKQSKSAKIIRWHLFLQEYSFDLSVVLGSNNLIADVLSRSFPSHDASTFAVQPLPPPDASYVDYCSLNSRYTHPSPSLPHLQPVQPQQVPTLAISSHSVPSDDRLALMARYHSDAFGHFPIADVTRMLTAHDLQWPDSHLDIDYFIARCPTCAITSCVNSTVFPLTPDQLVILRDHHNHVMGHHGIDTTLKLLRSHGHQWTGIKSHVVDLIQSCGHCQKNRSHCSVSVPEFTTTESYETFVMVAIDTLGPFPPSRRGHVYVFVIVCCFSSFVELVPSIDNTAHSAAEALLTVFGRYGAAFYLRSDNAPNFAGHVMAAFRRLLDISADFTIPYRPQSNGIVERKNLNVLTHLRALLTTSLDVTTNWCSLLPIAQRICNATDVSSIGCAPAQIIFGNLIHLNRGLDTSFTPPLPNSLGGTAYLEALFKGQQELVQASQRFLASVKDSRVASMGAPPSRVFPIGSHVLVAYPTDFRPKLANQLRGPYCVVAQSSSVYLLRSFVDDSKTISIHVSRLRPYIDNPAYHKSPTQVAATDFDESVVDYISTHTGTPSKPETLKFRVNWLGQGDDDATWQSYDSLKYNEALDNYIVDHLSDCPSLFHLVPSKDRTLLRVDTIGSHLFYEFSYGSHVLRVPATTVKRLSDFRSITATARRLTSSPSTH
jgi:hypothetical protein